MKEIARPMADRAHPRTVLRRYDAEGLWLAVMLAAVIGLFAAGAWSSYWAENRNDQYQLLYLGQCVYSGDALYNDCWENKPPGIAWINAFALAVASGRPFVAWLLPGAVGFLAVVVFYLAATRSVGFVPACLTSLLAGVVFSLRCYDATSINPDYYSAVFELAAYSLWALALGARRGRHRLAWGLTAGLVWAAAFAVKQTGVVGLMSVSLVALVTAFVARWRDGRWLAACVAGWVGFALGMGTVAMALSGNQTLGPALEAVFEFNSGLVDPQRLRGLFPGGSGIWGWIQPLELPLWLALIGAVGMLRCRDAGVLTQRFGTALVLWWVAEVALATMGPSRSPRYLQAAFPPMLWLCAAGMFHLGVQLQRTERVRRLVPAIMLATVVLLLGRPLLATYAAGAARSHVASQREPTQRQKLRAMGERIRQLATKADRIYVWNYDAGIYVHSGRRCAARFTYPRSPQQMREILESLKRGRAKLLLIPHGKASHFDRWCDEACHRDLDEILAQFELRTTIGNYQAWVQP